MNYISKFYINNNNVFTELYIFCLDYNLKKIIDFNDQNFIEVQLEFLNNEIFITHFSVLEIENLLKYKTNIYIINQNIYNDDNIENVKFKFIDYYNKINIEKICFEEVYLYGLAEEKFNAIEIFNILLSFEENTANRVISYNNVINYFLNFINAHEIISKLTKKETYTFEDILNFELDNIILYKKIGQSINTNSLNNLLTNNIFNIHSISSHFSKLTTADLATQNSDLIFEYNILYNQYYITILKDALDYTNAQTINENIIFKLYYPFLYYKNIDTYSNFIKNKSELITNTNKIVNSEEFINKNNYVELLHKIYNNNTNKLLYNEFGLKSINLNIDFQLDSVIPLELIFKILNSNYNIPLIKYNPGKNQENIYRLYTPNISSKNNKIPYLNKSTIFKYIKNIGKNNRIGLLINNTNSFYLEFTNNGMLDIKIDFQNLTDLISINKLLIDTINPILNTINKLLVNSNEKINLITSLLDKNIEIININYLINIKDVNLNKFNNYNKCFTYLFNVINLKKEKLNQNINMQYKHVSNYNNMNALEAFILELIKNSYNEETILTKIQENFNMDEITSKTKFLEFISSLDLETQQNSYKRLKIKNNPGFSTKIYNEKFSNNIIVDINNINNINYLTFIPIYIDSIIKIINEKNIQDDTSQIEDLCKKSKKNTDKKLIDDLKPEITYEDMLLKQSLKDDLNITENSTEQHDNPINLLLEDDSNSDSSTNEYLNDLLFSDNDEDNDELNDELKDELKDIEIKEELTIQEDTENQLTKEEQDDAQEPMIIKKDNIKIQEEQTDTDLFIDKDIDVTGMNLHPNPILKRLETREPKLFVQKDNLNFKGFSRICPTNAKRQPVIITDEEKERIDKEHTGSYTEAFKYGTEPNKQYWYICPRYWDLKRNVSLTHEQVISGKYGKIIPDDVKKIPEGYNIYEFRSEWHSDNKNNYIDHAPGFLKNTYNTKEDFCLPCCFKDWNSKKSQENRAKCIDKIKVEVPTDSNFYEYVQGADKFPLEHKRCGVLPLNIQIFLQQNNDNCINKKTNMLLFDEPCLLRYGVVSSQNQSFISCIADLYGSIILNKDIDIRTMRTIIIGAIDIDRFISLNNGNLIQIFKNKDQDVILQTDIEEYKSSKFFNNLNENNIDHIKTFKTIINSFNNFSKYLLSDDNIIDYTYLWDVICSKNPKLFKNGINLIILEEQLNDITNNVNVLCPQQNYSHENIDIEKQCLILIKRDNLFEPIYKIHNSKSLYNISKTFNFNIPENSFKEFKKILNTIRIHINKYCKINRNLSSKNLTEFEININLTNIIKIVSQLKFDILYQIINYNNKIIGIVINKSNFLNAKNFFIPCYPSGINNEIHSPIKFMDDYTDYYYNNYKDTITALNMIYQNSNNKIKVKPIIKVIEDELIVGIITNANQFVMLNEPEMNIEDDDLEILNDHNLLEIDSKIQKNYIEDKTRENISHFIKLETGFYNLFKLTIRQLILDYKNIAIKQKINNIVNSISITYYRKIEQLIQIIQDFTRHHFIFSDYNPDVLDKIKTITSCADNDENNLWCLYKDISPSVQNILIIPKLNLITKKDNKTIYYSRFCDQLLRNNLFQTSIFDKTDIINNVKYVINDDEIIIYENLLNKEFFKNISNKNITNFTNYDNMYIEKEPIVLNFTDTDKDNISNIKKQTNIEKTDRLKITLSPEINNKEMCKFMKTGVKETILKEYFINELFELYTDIDNKRECSYSILLEIFNNNNIKLTINQIKTKLVELYRDTNLNYTLFTKHITRQKHNLHNDKMIVNQSSFDIELYIMSENYYISMCDIYILFKYYKIPVIFLCTTYIPIYLKFDIGMFNFIVGYSQPDITSYYFIKINSSHIRYREGQLTNHKLLSFKNKYLINVEELKGPIKNQIQKFITDKIDIYNQFIDKFLTN